MAEEFSAKQRKAAILVAEDELTDEQIAGACTMAPRTLYRLKTLPEFQALVREHIARLGQELSRYAIARKDKRMAAYQSRWEKLHTLIDARSKALAYEIAGGETGLVTKEIEIARDGTVVENYSTDTGLLSSMANLEKQAAVEAGQWTEKKDVTSGGESLADQLARLMRTPIQVEIVGENPFHVE